MTAASWGEIVFLTVLAVAFVPALAMLLGVTLLRSREPRIPAGLTRLVRAGYVALSFVPATWLFLFALLVVRARIILGFWPYPRSGNPIVGEYRESPLDPMALPMHCSILWLLLPVLMPSAAYMVLAHLLLVRSGQRPRGLHVALFSFAYVGWWLLVLTDPFQFVEWFVD